MRFPADHLTDGCVLRISRAIAAALDHCPRARARECGKNRECSQVSREKIRQRETSKKGPIVPNTGNVLQDIKDPPSRKKIFPLWKESARVRFAREGRAKRCPGRALVSRARELPRNVSNKRSMRFQVTRSASSTASARRLVASREARPSESPSSF